MRPAQPFPPRTDEYNLDNAVTHAELIDSYWRQAQRTESMDAVDLEAPCRATREAADPHTSSSV